MTVTAGRKPRASGRGKASFQGSLLDLGAEAHPGPFGALLMRTPLSRGAWVDVRPGWLTGAAGLFGRLAEHVPWRAEKRPLPDPALEEARAALNAHYEAGLGEPLVTAGLCLYRDGRDSVAWHGDTTGRGSTEDTLVAIVSLGAPRALLLRPRGGGSALRFELGHGDLIVMGGSCQRTWEHAVPKTARPVGPRISMQFRPRGVR